MSREPSMEEILSSIRRVIARDDAPQGGDLARRLTPMADPASDQSGDGWDAEQDDDDDILELTDAQPASDEAMDDEPMPTPAPLSAAAPAPAAAAAVPPPQPVPESPALAATNAAPAPALVSPVSAAASRQSLDALAAALAGGRTEQPAQPAAGGDLSVNALVEAALRPMLKTWLDAHLPEMVERLVAKEISRITGARL